MIFYIYMLSIIHPKCSLYQLNSLGNVFVKVPFWYMDIICPKVNILWCEKHCYALNHFTGNITVGDCQFNWCRRGQNLWNLAKVRRCDIGHILTLSSQTKILSLIMSRARHVGTQGNQPFLHTTKRTCFWTVLSHYSTSSHFNSNCVNITG